MMKNRVIGWVQGESTDTPSVIFYNDKLISPSEKSYSELYRELVDTKAYSKIYDVEDLVLYKNLGNDYLIYSNFIEQDVVGRRIAFMCKVHCPLDEIESAISEFEKKVNRTINPNSIATIIQEIKKKNKRQQVIVVSAIGFIVLSVILLALWI